MDEDRLAPARGEGADLFDHGREQVEHRRDRRAGLAPAGRADVVDADLPLEVARLDADPGGREGELQGVAAEVDRRHGGGLDVHDVQALALSGLRHEVAAQGDEGAPLLPRDEVRAAHDHRAGGEDPGRQRLDLGDEAGLDARADGGRRFPRRLAEARGDDQLARQVACAHPLDVGGLEDHLEGEVVDALHRQGELHVPPGQRADHPGLDEGVGEEAAAGDHRRRARQDDVHLDALDRDGERGRRALVAGAVGGGAGGEQEAERRERRGPHRTHPRCPPPTSRQL
ncbi:MAG: hypothetical protein R3F43_12715 [bacterium]